MTPRWLAVLASICALAALAGSAAVPTPDTIVVTKSSADTDAPTTVSPVEEATSEGPLPAIKLTEMAVTSQVRLRYAHTAVVARVRNPAPRAQEAHFRVLLPDTAFISGFVMTIDGKSYTAYVKEKEEAKQIYQDAISQGLGAAHISTKARDSNHFTVAVNIEALSSAIFNLTYEELLTRRNNVYNHAINLHPGTVVPKLTVTVNIKESEKISELRVPEVRTGNEIDATKDDTQNSLVTIVKSDDEKEATITFTPDLQEQERLMQIYAQKSKESAEAKPRYSWSDEQEEKAPEGVLGQFVVQYDVARPKDGEILVNDGYFVHFFAPTDLPPLNKFVVFVLDTSGSMSDRKIIQLREAMKVILGDLHPGDYFSIVEFDSGVKVHDLKEAEGEPPKSNYYYYEPEEQTVLVPPSQATPENIQKAKVIVSWLQASGGTNIGKALDIAVQLINKGIDWKPEPNVTSSAAKAKPAKDSVTPAPAETSTAVTKVTAEKTKKQKSVEPIIIFLTDGDATVGEVNPKRIMKTVAEKNDGPNRATLFSLAFGDDADRKFLRKISYRNGGFSRHIYEAADAALQLHDFYRQISSPLLANVKFSYANDQVKESSLTKHEFRTLYAGSELVVAGRVEDAAQLTPTVSAFCGVDDGYGRKLYELTPKVPVNPKNEGFLPLERLWSYLTIKQLLEQQEATDDDEKPADQDKENTPEKKALRLALKYSFVTPVTSLVVVKPNATSSVDAESVDKAANFLPGGTPLSGGSMFNSPLAFSAFGAPGMPAPSASLFTRPGVHYAMAADDFAEEEEYTDEIALGPVSSTPAQPQATSTTAKPDLSTYQLQDYPWAQSVLNVSSDSLVLLINGLTINLKLARDGFVPREDPGKKPQDCRRAVDGGAGVCVYLTRCRPAQHINLNQFVYTYCSVHNGYAGVCCQPEKVDAE